MSPKKTMITLKMTEVDFKNAGNQNSSFGRTGFKLQQTALLNVKEEWTPTPTPKTKTPKERYQTELRPKQIEGSVPVWR